MSGAHNRIVLVMIARTNTIIWIANYDVSSCLILIRRYKMQEALHERGAWYHREERFDIPCSCNGSISEATTPLVATESFEKTDLGSGCLAPYEIISKK